MVPQRRYNKSKQVLKQLQINYYNTANTKQLLKHKYNTGTTEQVLHKF